MSIFRRLINAFRLPRKLPIVRMEEYHTHYLGQTKDGLLFWGYQTFAFTPRGPRSLENRMDYAVLHTFSAHGKYLNTQHWSMNATAPGSQSLLDEKLEEFVAALGPVTYKDIEIKLFRTVIDGITFGLIPSYEDEDLSVELQPSSTISFQPPWDGEYNT